MYQLNNKTTFCENNLLQILIIMIILILIYKTFVIKDQMDRLDHRAVEERRAMQEQLELQARLVKLVK